VIKATALRGLSVFKSFRFPALGALFGLLPFLMSVGSLNVGAQPAIFPDVSVEGTVRIRAEKELLLQTNTNKVLRFRLLAGTEFRARDGKPFRDSLIHPGDQIVVDVNSGDVETAIDIIFIASASSSARESALLPVESARVVVPELSDFHSGPGPAGSNSEKAAPPPVQPAPQSAERRAVAPSPPAQPPLETTPQKIVKDLGLGRSLLFRNRADSVAALNRAADGCDAAHSVSPDCAEAYELLGFVLNDGKHLETLRSKIEPLYRKAVAIYENGPPDEMFARSLELEGYALKQLGDLAESQNFLDRAFPIRAHIVESMGPQARSDSPPNYRPEDSVTQPALVYKREPEYSEWARMTKIAGTVVLSMVIEPEGYASNFKLVKSLGLGLDEEAEKAVSQWRFRPATKDGKAVRRKVTVEVNFRLL
jgi:TonB family protein